MEIIALIFLFFMSIIIHEVSHGYTAYLLGDSTAKNAGRLTLNPAKHIDIFYTVILPLVLFISTQGRFAVGMAKPVPVNFSALRYPRRDIPLVALAGPLANFVISIVLALFWRYTQSTFILYAIYFNLGIAFFNLLPIPPLDGSKVIAGILPWNWMISFLKFERFGFLIILVLYFSGVLMHIILPLIDICCAGLHVPGPYQLFTFVR